MPLNNKHQLKKLHHMTSIKEQATTLIAQSQPQQAIQLLLNYFEDKNELEPLNNITLISANLNRLKKQQLMGTISLDDSSRETNRINYRLLSIIDEIPNEQTKSIKDFADRLAPLINRKDTDLIYDELITAFDDNTTQKKLIIINKSEFSNIEQKIEALSQEGKDKFKDLLNQRFADSIQADLQGFKGNEITIDLLNQILKHLNEVFEKVKVEIAESAKNTDGVGVKKILFLTSNPNNLHTIGFGKETQIIRNELQKSKYRNQFNLLSPIAAVQYDEIDLLIENADADIIHISLHGSKDKGLVLENSSGNPKHITPKQLKVILSTVINNLKKKPECILLNACHSDQHAKILKDNALGQNTIGMKGYIPDDSALAYTKGFYRHLFNNNSDYSKAYNRGKAMIEVVDVELEGEENKWEECPQLY